MLTARRAEHYARLIGEIYLPDLPRFPSLAATPLRLAGNDNGIVGFGPIVIIRA